jgi:hypothetical protein
MSKIHPLSYVGPTLVICALGYFVYYSLYVYQPTNKPVCYQSVVAQQTDLAVHVVRQWFGKSGDQYSTCQS